MQDRFAIITLKPSRLPKNTRDFVLRTVTRREEIKTLRLALRKGHYLGLRTLQDEWEKQHQSRPLLAESFHDPAHHTGTLYKATNWTPLGFTKSFTLVK